MSGELATSREDRGRPAADQTVDTASIDVAGLHRALQVLAAARTLADAVPHLLETLGGGMAWDLAALLVVDEPERRLRSVRGWAAQPALSAFLDATDQMTFAPGEGIPGLVWETEAPVWSPDVTIDGRYLRRLDAAASGLRTGVFLPLAAGSRFLGVLELYSHERRERDASALALLGPYAEIIGQFIERVRAEEAARERDGRYRAIIQTSLDAVVLVDAAGLITDWNPRAEEIFGWSADEVRGRALHEVMIPPELVAAHRRAFRRFLHTRRPRVLGQRLEMPAVHRDGGRLTVELSIVAHEVGGSVSFTGSMRDLTAELEAQAEIRRNAEGIRSLYRVASDPALDLLGRVRKLLELLTERFGMGTGVLSQIVADGLQVMAVDANDSRLAAGSVFPLSESFSAEAIARNDVLAITDAAREGWADHPAHARHGLAAFIGAPVEVGGRIAGALSFSSPLPRPQAFREGDVDLLRLMARWVGGEWERDQVARRLEQANEELADAATAAREMARIADEASRAKSEFVAAMSHEVRTPLHGIIGSIEVLKTEPSPDRWREFVASLDASAGHLLRIVDDVLDFSRVEAGTLALQPAPVDIRTVARELQATYGPAATSRGVRLDVAVDDDVPAALVTDGTRLRQVIVNLLANAVKFTPSGSVEVKVMMGHADLGPSDDDRSLRVRVADTGIGMDAATIERVFEPFFQADASTSRQYGGAGLGLAITRRLVDLMGGTIEASSTPGEGTVMTVRLPVQEEGGVSPSLPVPLAVIGEESTADHGRQAPLSASRTETPVRPVIRSAVLGAAPVERRTGPSHPRVLVVDDDPVSLAVARNLLEREGCDVRIASTGPAALELLAGGDHDLVLLDCRLPVIDGFEVARRHRRSEQKMGRAPLPIVAMTADAYAETRAECLRAGMSDYLAKPYRSTELRAVLERWLSGDGPEVSGSPDGTRDPAPATTLPDEGAIPVGALLEAFREGGPRRAHELTLVFLETLAAGEAELLPAMREGRTEDAVAAAHRLRGAASLAGLTDLARMLARVEAEVPPPPASTDGRIERLAGEIEQARHRMRTLAARLEPSVGEP